MILNEGSQAKQMDQQITALKALLEVSHRVVVFTGAGISTESGIPDFRSADGLWTKMEPIEYQDYITSEAARRRSWRMHLEMGTRWRDAKPNRGHRAVAELVRRGTCRAVITQNVDGLHQAAGVPEDRVIELHGNTTYAHCIQCRTRYDLAPIMAAFRERETLPTCELCGGIVKTAAIYFGEAMPEEAMRLAQAHTLACDLFLVLGSSLVVYPAAGFPELAVRMAKPLAIVNREDTDLDAMATLVLHREIGETLGEAVGVS